MQNDVTVHQFPYATGSDGHFKRICTFYAVMHACGCTVTFIYGTGTLYCSLNSQLIPIFKKKLGLNWKEYAF